jgi:HrpA-like RNA helicase
MTRDNTFLAEERFRVEEAHHDPDGRRGRMRAAHDALPITPVRRDLVKSLRPGRVEVVSGGTSSSKLTQCPLYILEDAIACGRGAKMRIVVTKPRRIAAMSVAVGCPI